MQRKSLYRYSAKKWNKALMQQGSARIGTLRDFRRQEHKPGISDPFEGTKTIRHVIDNWEWGKEIPGFPTYHARAAELIGLIQPNPNQNYQQAGGSISGITVLMPVDDPDCFVYCTSNRRSKNVMGQFQGADSCVEIYDIQGFYECLTNEINKRVPIKWGGLADVRYTTRDEICNGVDLGISPTWIKGNEFVEQYETRAVWHPVDPEQAIEPFTIETLELSRFCRKVKAR